MILLPKQIPLQIIALLLSGFFLLFEGCQTLKNPEWKWEVIDAKGTPTARHEAGVAVYDDKLYLMGGRRINPTSVYDPINNSWTEKSEPPVEIHHFQPVVIDDAIYLVGAMTGGWPREKALDRVIIYHPDEDKYEYSHTIPIHRRRGGAGAVAYNGKIYLVGGITNGHMDGYRTWLDEYDPQTGDWKVLADAPTARDHFQAVIVGDKLYALAGRTTSKRTEQDMALTTPYGNVYDFKKKKWEPVTTDLAIPTLRAGNSAFGWNNEVVIGGGESTAHVAAHHEIEAYNVSTKSWRQWPSMNQGRHGTGFVKIGDYLYTASGCGNRGGEPELTSIERLRLPVQTSRDKEVPTKKQIPVYGKWHTVTFSFEGPKTSETAEENPFLNYRLEVEFVHANSKYNIRGFYAADGNAAASSASSGNIWQARFTPDQEGEWTYNARLYHGEDIALMTDMTQAESINLNEASGSFIVTRSEKDVPDFRGRGRLQIANGMFRFQDSDQYWLKTGTNSPENFLAYHEIDGTYRIKAEAQDGEATAPEQVHKYASHEKDWHSGDPVWQQNKGKGIIGAVNYLASKGMNSIYFLTLNILGDGKDVWPYENPKDFTRFDVSKLEQWDIIFQHMQSKGILLHIVTQETENETMLDNGNTERLRKLYYDELIARFGHHLALVWNLGEENGPAEWSPIGQNDTQRKAMSSYLKASDPYQHPVLLHTHSHDPLRVDILEPLLGYKDLDGLSLQVDKREGAGDVVAEWRNRSRAAGQEWLITMDEIGMWHTAVLPDDQDPEHPTIRKYALWGTLLSGAAGVEWYFGAKHPHNDLSSEDWRQRDRLWDLTRHANNFIETYLPYWDMLPARELINSEEAFCLRKSGELYAIYLPDNQVEYTINLEEAKGDFDIKWYNPLQGGPLMEGSKIIIQGGDIRTLGSAPQLNTEVIDQDWIVLLRQRVN